MERMERKKHSKLLNIKQNKCAWFLANSKFVGAHYLSELLKIINKSNKTVECWASIILSCKESHLQHFKLQWKLPNTTSECLFFYLNQRQTFKRGSFFIKKKSQRRNRYENMHKNNYANKTKKTLKRNRLSIALKWIWLRTMVHNITSNIQESDQISCSSL